MANKNLFATTAGKLAPKTDTVNEAGGRAYALTPKQALAQYAATGCLNGTFYASATEQLDQVLTFCSNVDGKTDRRPPAGGRLPTQLWLAQPQPALSLIIKVALRLGQPSCVGSRPPAGGPPSGLPATTT